MYTPVYTRQFAKDIERLRKRGKDFEKLKIVIRTLASGEPLDRLHRDHKLIGDYKNRRECHIESDWLLIYKLSGSTITFERSGSHSDLLR